jgi:ABC-type transport system involved in cytochrome c biogenesis permease subunit
MPILSEGRVKPLESFARSNLSESFILKKKYYSYYIAEILFSFNLFSDKKIFKITNENILINIDLKKNKKSLYSINDILPGIFKNIEIINILLKSDPILLSAAQIELLSIYNKINFILNIRESFKFLDNIKNTDNVNIVEYFYIIKINDHKWVNINTPDIIVWDFKNISNKLKIMKNTYNINHQDWNDACLNFNNYSLSKLNAQELFKLKIEKIYNKMNFLFYGTILYFMFFVMSCLIIIKEYSLLINVVKYLLKTGIILILFDIILRLLVSGRPPVTNLYESIIFVNFVCSILFFNLFKKFKTPYTFVVVSFFLFILQLIGYKYNYDAEIKNLMSVLNTNFWLTLHVLTITTGYSCCLISSALSHVGLYYTLSKDNSTSKNIYTYTNAFIVTSLFFSFSGTILGGVWADQSWGRFWGWDPKENGALLIVLWLTLILHVKLINNSKIYFFVGVILLSVIVAISWFGVNILNVGLHSYGFTKNVSIWLTLFIFFELSYIIILLYKNLTRGNQI